MLQTTSKMPARSTTRSTWSVASCPRSVHITEARSVHITLQPGTSPLPSLESRRPYRGTSLIRNSPPLGPHSRTMPRLLWRS